MSYDFRVDYIARLVSLSNQFRDMKMPETAHTIMKFLEFFSKNTVQISLLENAFDMVLKKAEEEFGNRNEHSKRCAQMMLRHIQILFTNPEYDKILDELIEIMRNRRSTVNTWNVLVGILAKEDHDYKERFAVLNQEYANKIEGLYKIDIRICYLISKFTMNKSASWKKIVNTNTNEMKIYYKNNFEDTSLFEGWNNHIRNAIAHSGHHYDEQNMVMRYEDEKSDWKTELTYNELFDMSQKLMNVCELVDVLVRLISIRKYSMLQDVQHYKLLGMDIVVL